MLGLTNRETAALMWLAIVIVGALLIPAVRAHVPSLLRSMFAWKIVVAFVLFAAYLVGVTLLANHLGLWVPTLASDSAVWFVTVALGLFLASNEALKKRRHYRRVFLTAIGVVAYLEVLAGLYSLPIWAEFVTQGLLTFFFLLALVASGRPDSQGLAGCLNMVVAVAGLSIFVVSIWHLVTDAAAGTFDWPLFARRLALPLWMTLAAIMFLWCLSLVMAYESAFTRLKLTTATGASQWRATLALILSTGVRTVSLGTFGANQARPMVRATSVRGAMAAYREAMAAADATSRPLHPVAADAEATRKSLMFLSTCHMGHYRHNDRYRPDLLAVVESSFSDFGLPDDHGINHVVIRDGSAWCAWRQIRDGRIVGIGANAPPPDTWYFESDAPPEGPPPGLGWSDQFADLPEGGFWP